MAKYTAQFMCSITIMIRTSANTRHKYCQVGSWDIAKMATCNWTCPVITNGLLANVYLLYYYRSL